jgi:transcriptional regulator with XRE-family HTH domain
LEAGLSQEELGRSSKMSTSYISRLETGEVNPTVDALTRIVRVFGLSIDGLLELNTDAPTILASDDLDPEIRVWLFKLKSKKVSTRTKRIIQIVIEEELKELEGVHS